MPLLHEDLSAVVLRIVICRSKSNLLYLLAKRLFTDWFRFHHEEVHLVHSQTVFRKKKKKLRFRKSYSVKGVHSYDPTKFTVT